MVLDDTPVDKDLAATVQVLAQSAGIAVRVVHETSPSWLLELRGGGQGRLLMIWSNLYADRYASAQHIAITDMDAPFFMQVTPQMLFRQGLHQPPSLRSTPAPRPTLEALF